MLQKAGPWSLVHRADSPPALGCCGRTPLNANHSTQETQKPILFIHIPFDSLLFLSFHWYNHSNIYYWLLLCLPLQKNTFTTQQTAATFLGFGFTSNPTVHYSPSLLITGEAKRCAEFPVRTGKYLTISWKYLHFNNFWSIMDHFGIYFDHKLKETRKLQSI